MSAEILAELARVKAIFQLRAVEAAMGLPFIVRDSGSDPQGENAPAVEGVASQNGGANSHASP